jgi:hypothetical protein
MKCNPLDFSHMDKVVLTLAGRSSGSDPGQPLLWSEEDSNSEVTAVQKESLHSREVTASKSNKAYVLKHLQRATSAQASMK